MKTYNKYILSFLVSLVLYGCTEEFVNRPSLIQENADNFYQNEEDIFQAMVACYNAVQLQTDRESWVPHVTVSDIMSDHAYAGGSESNDGISFQQ